MPRRPPPTDQDAVARARAWLDRQHDRAHRQVLALLCETPTEAISQAPGQLSTGELRALSRHPRTPATVRDRRIVTPPGGQQPPRVAFC